MKSITISEFDVLIPPPPDRRKIVGLHVVPATVFEWLDAQCLRLSAERALPWVRLVLRSGRRGVQVTSFVGVIRAPGGFQIEVLPKLARVLEGGHNEARALLIEMLRCLGEFRHIQTSSANLKTVSMPLLEIFIADFLRSVAAVVKHGVRADYVPHQDNLFALRGKLMIAQHLRKNLCRADCFFSEHDQFSPNRPENRLLRAALETALRITRSQENQQLARELSFVFSDIPASVDVDQDFHRVRSDRGMAYYDNAMAWTRIILDSNAPLTGAGKQNAPSLLFPMEALFEAFVAKHLQRQLAHSYKLKAQPQSNTLVRHESRNWFKLKPDLLVVQHNRNCLVLDTKWKLLDGGKMNGSDKYGLAQSDFYQLHAYGHSYLQGEGDVILIYPKTEIFASPPPVFEFPESKGLRLWVLPYCLKYRKLILPTGERAGGFPVQHFLNTP